MIGSDAVKKAFTEGHGRRLVLTAALPTKERAAVGPPFEFRRGGRGLRRERPTYHVRFGTLKSAIARSLSLNWVVSLPVFLPRPGPAFVCHQAPRRRRAGQILES